MLRILPKQVCGSVVAVLFLAASSLGKAAILFTNFGAGDSFSTSSYPVYSPQNLAVSFTANTTANLSSVRTVLARNQTASTLPLTVSLVGPSPDPRGTVLETRSVARSQVSFFGPTKITLTSVRNPKLVGGSVYWLVATLTDPTQASYVWNQAVSAKGLSFSNDGGATWGPTRDLAQPVFEINGTPTSLITGGPYEFVPLAPCRIADTRNSPGTFGAPALARLAPRDFPVPSSGCNIPPTAAAYALNVTVVPKGPLGYVSICPTGTSQPVVSTLNSVDGRTKPNAAITPAGTSGSITFIATEPTELIVDINGYFRDPNPPASLQFYPLTPCRIADTRNQTGPFGGPSLAALVPRTIPVPTSNCAIPASARAYSLNATVVPKGPFGFLTLWPTGAARPLASTLNAVTGTVTANAAIVTSGTSGSIDVFGSENTDLILDINGYFAPAGAGGLSFFTIQPCRISDTRLSPNGPFAGPAQSALAAREYAMGTSPCTGGPAAAYSVNATVVPGGALGYLALWPSGQSQPTVSTLNAVDGAITSNAAIVTGGTNSSAIRALTTETTHLILDINGVFRAQ